MKNTIISLASMTAMLTGLDAQTFLDFNTLTDTSGALIGNAASGQVFDLGGGLLLTATYSGSFASVNNSPFAQATGGVGNQIAPGAGNTLSNIITFTTNSTADFNILSQANNTASRNGSGVNFEVGSVVADGAITLITNTGITPFTVAGSTLSYDASVSGSTRGQFEAAFTGTTFTYNYSATGFDVTNDPFQIAVTASSVPEPSSLLLIAFGGLGVLTRRKR